MYNVASNEKWTTFWPTSGRTVTSVWRTRNASFSQNAGLVYWRFLLRNPAKGWRKLPECGQTHRLEQTQIPVGSQNTEQETQYYLSTSSEWFQTDSRAFETRKYFK
jgi:hypothetical protein